jgi:hypothetical protein
MSLNTWTPLFCVMPPKKKQSAPDDLILAAFARKLAAFGSYPSLPRTSRPCWAGDLLDLVGEALPVDLLVVQDVELRAAVVLHVGRLRGGLDVVRGHDAGVRALAGGVVLLRLALLGAFGARQAHVGVRRGHHRDSGLVEDRQRDGRSAGVELADVADRRVVAHDLAGVGGRLAGIPLAGRRGRVVERDVLQRVVAGLATGLIERELDAAHDVLGLRARVALEGQG